MMTMQKNSNSTFCDKYIINNNNNNNNNKFMDKKNIHVHDRIQTDATKLQLYPSE